MNKITKYALLFLLIWPYIAVSIFDIAFGILSLIMNAIRVPFNVASAWLIDKANDINIK
jgi:hypothetical protein